MTNPIKKNALVIIFYTSRPTRLLDVFYCKGLRNINSFKTYKMTSQLYLQMKSSFSDNIQHLSNKIITLLHPSIYPNLYESCWEHLFEAIFQKRFSIYAIHKCVFFWSLESGLEIADTTIFESRSLVIHLIVKVMNLSYLILFLKLRQYKNDFIQSKKKILFWNCRSLTSPPSYTTVGEKHGNFKIGIFLDWMESFLYCLTVCQKGVKKKKNVRVSGIYFWYRHT